MWYHHTWKGSRIKHTLNTILIMLQISNTWTAGWSNPGPPAFRSCKLLNFNCLVFFEIWASSGTFSRFGAQWIQEIFFIFGGFWPLMRCIIIIWWRAVGRDIIAIAKRQISPFLFVIRFGRFFRWRRRCDKFPCTFRLGVVLWQRRVFKRARTFAPGFRFQFSHLIQISLVFYKSRSGANTFCRFRSRAIFYVGVGFGGFVFDVIIVRRRIRAFAFDVTVVTRRRISLLLFMERLVPFFCFRRSRWVLPWADFSVASFLGRKIVSHWWMIVFLGVPGFATFFLF